MMSAESRDRSVATNSLVSSMGTARATTIFTGVGGGPWFCALPPRQPMASATANTHRPWAGDSVRSRARAFVPGGINSMNGPNLDAITALMRGRHAHDGLGTSIRSAQYVSPKP
jgi:hypothetical protein